MSPGSAWTSAGRLPTATAASAATHTKTSRWTAALKLLSTFVQAFEFSKVNLLNTAFRFIGELIITRWFQVGLSALYNLNTCFFYS